LSYLQSVAKDVVLSPDLISLRNELQVKFGNNDELTNCNVPINTKYFENIIETTNSPSRKISVGYQEENFALSRYVFIRHIFIQLIIFNVNLYFSLDQTRWVIYLL